MNEENANKQKSILKLKTFIRCTARTTSSLKHLKHANDAQKPYFLMYIVK